MNIQHPISKYGSTYNFTLLQYSELDIENWIFLLILPFPQAFVVCNYFCAFPNGKESDCAKLERC